MHAWRQSLICIGAVFTAALGCRGEDLTVGTETFVNIEVARVEPDAVTVRHATGVCRLSFTNLPVAWQKKYNYQPQKAADYARKMRTQQAAQLAQRNRQKEIERVILAETALVDVQVVARKRDGVVVQGSNLVSREVAYTATKRYAILAGPSPWGGPGAPVSKAVAVQRTKQAEEYEPFGPVYMVGLPSTLRVGSSWYGYAYPVPGITRDGLSLYAPSLERATAAAMPRPERTPPPAVPTPEYTVPVEPAPSPTPLPLPNPTPTPLPAQTEPPPVKIEPVVPPAIEEPPAPPAPPPVEPEEAPLWPLARPVKPSEPPAPTETGFMDGALDMFFAPFKTCGLQGMKFSTGKRTGAYFLGVLAGLLTQFAVLASLWSVFQKRRQPPERTRR